MAKESASSRTFIGSLCTSCEVNDIHRFRKSKEQEERTGINSSILLRDRQGDSLDRQSHSAPETQVTPLIGSPLSRDIGELEHELFVKACKEAQKRNKKREKKARNLRLL